MKKMAMAMKPIQKIEQDKLNAKYRIRKTQTVNGQEREITHYIYFVKVLGNWKIAQY